MGTVLYPMGGFLWDQGCLGRTWFHLHERVGKVLGCHRIGGYLCRAR
jgi:hypothetical protein